MFVLGVTGSLAVGKSTVARLLRQNAVPVHDADATVHRLLSGAAVPGVVRAFGTGLVDDTGAVDRAALARVVFSDLEALTRLESLLHPLVMQDRARFLKRSPRARLVALDIPLLYERGLEGQCDAVLVVHAPLFLQKQRALRRPGMTHERFDNLLARQMPQREKLRRAQWVVQTGLGLRKTRTALKRLLHCLNARDDSQGGGQ